MTHGCVLGSYQLARRHCNKYNRTAESFENCFTQRPERRVGAGGVGGRGVMGGQTTGWVGRPVGRIADNAKQSRLQRDNATRALVRHGANNRHRAWPVSLTDRFVGRGR